MLEKHHSLSMNQRTLKRRLKDFGLTRREMVDEELKEWVKDIILQEICTSPDSLIGTEQCGIPCVLDTRLMFLEDWLNHQ